MSDRCILTVHAHPDDEASKGAGTVRRAVDDGARAVLVCCTGGEEGDILNPALDTPEVRADLGAVRRAELDRSVEIIGYTDLFMLGHHDSGMPDSEANARPEAFWNVPVDHSTDQLVEIIRATRPQVVLAYDEEHGGYPHPDHIRAHEIAVAAYDLAADAAHRPDLGEPWEVLKLYFTIFSKARLEGIHRRMVELGIESPFDDDWFARPWQDHRITTTVPVADQFPVRKAALLAHATQVAPDSPFWFGLPDDDLVAIHPYEDYALAAHRLGDYEPVGDGPNGTETDVFAGIGVRARG